MASADEKKAAMRAALDDLSAKADNPEFAATMDGFYNLFCRSIDEVDDSVAWDAIELPGDELVRPYDGLDGCPEDARNELLGKLAVLKLNGGLGTTMGCVGPKSAIEVREGATFLDLIVEQIKDLNASSGASVPLVLMNSFNTSEDTAGIVTKYEGEVDVINFEQSRMPRFFKDTNLPVPQEPESPNHEWYPPGHGDIYFALVKSGVVDQLIDAGKEFIFISNVDNLGATVDLDILHALSTSDAEYVMEVTDKTLADVKGGTIIRYNGGVKLLELAQVAPENVEEFKSINKFKIFNTNNMWVRLEAIKRLVEEGGLKMDVIINNKKLPTGEAVIQLEQAAGAAIEFFASSFGVNVPRSRFLPVKTTNDLFLVQTDLYEVNSGTLTVSSARKYPTAPMIRLSTPEFGHVAPFAGRFAGMPSIVELDHLTVSGDVTFGEGIVLKGTVIVVAPPGSALTIDAGTVLENQVVTVDAQGARHILSH